MLAKLIAIVVLIWFYKSAKKVGENPIQWAIFGVIGFFISASLAHYLVIEPLLTILPLKSKLSPFVRQLPLLIGVASVYLIKTKKLTQE